jgi:hypothetical protein
MKPFDLFHKLKDVLISPLRIGALEVSSTSIKYLLVRGTSIVQASLRLPPGVVEKGVIKNHDVFIAALKNLHLQISPALKPINVILTVPSNLVFTQAFDVPMVAKESLPEAIKLNLQMVSPNKIEESYYDYQEIKINKDLGHIDLLGAFTAIPPIDEYEKALRATNFIPVAVEFPGLALARLIRERWGGIELEQHYLLIYVSGEGVLMMILKNGNLAFNHFSPWQDANGQNTTPLNFTEVKELIKREIQRVMNFYMSRTGKSIEEAVLISPVFNYEIVKVASEDLKLKIRNLTIAELPKLQPSWFPALGSALRGLISRSKDTDISLAATGSQAEYYEERALEFIDLWRNIILGTLVLVLGSFILIDTVFYRQEKQLGTWVAEAVDETTVKGSVMVREKIASFNKLLSTIDSTVKNENSWSPTLINLQKLAEKNISFDRILINKADLHGSISGRGSSDEAILAFKDRLEKDSRTEAVNLPLSNIKAEPDKSASFSLSITFKKS